MVPSPDRFPVQISLSLETLTKLERLGMTHSVAGCACLDVHLLYDRPIVREITIHS